MNPMRTTLNIDASLLAKASSLTGIKEKAALVRMGRDVDVPRMVQWGAGRRRAAGRRWR